MKLRLTIPTLWNGPASQPLQFPNLQDGIERLHEEASSGLNAAQARKLGKTQNEEK